MTDVKAAILIVGHDIGDFQPIRARQEAVRGGTLLESSLSRSENNCQERNCDLLKYNRKVVKSASHKVLGKLWME